MTDCVLPSDEPSRVSVRAAPASSRSAVAVAKTSVAVETLVRGLNQLHVSTCQAMCTLDSPSTIQHRLTSPARPCRWNRPGTQQQWQCRPGALRTQRVHPPGVRRARLCLPAFRPAPAQSAGSLGCQDTPRGTGAARTAGVRAARWQPEATQHRTHNTAGWPHGQ